MSNSSERYVVSIPRLNVLEVRFRLAKVPKYVRVVILACLENHGGRWGKYETEDGYILACIDAYRAYRRSKWLSFNGPADFFFALERARGR